MYIKIERASAVAASRHLWEKKQKKGVTLVTV